MLDVRSESLCVLGEHLSMRVGEIGVGATSGARSFAGTVEIAIESLGDPTRWDEGDPQLRCSPRARALRARDPARGIRAAS